MGRPITTFLVLKDSVIVPFQVFKHNLYYGKWWFPGVVSGLLNRVFSVNCFNNAKGTLSFRNASGL